MLFRSIPAHRFALSLCLAAALPAALSACGPGSAGTELSIPQSPDDEGDTHEGLLPDEGDVAANPIAKEPDAVAKPPARNPYIPDPNQLPVPIIGEIEQARGGYAGGSLVNESVIAADGAGFVKLFQSKDRGFGTVDLISILESVAARFAQAYPKSERLQVGDLSDRNGGSVSGHSSHQNGLDVDLSYFRKDGREGIEETSFVEEFVQGGKLTGNFDLERNWALMKAWVATERVNRIFVDSAIKKAFCAHAKETGELESQKETLRRLRPWPNHGDHHHLRITCPKNSPACKPQADVSPGHGC